MTNVLNTCPFTNATDSTQAFCGLSHSEVNHIAVAKAAARADMAASVFAMKKRTVPVSESRNTHLFRQSPTARPINTHVHVVLILT